jgi:sugar/nucleoside kinase (ribokinase family)
MSDLCTVGELLWLTTLELTKFPKPGETTPVKNVHRMIGNDAAIVAIMASQMGLTVDLCSNPVSKKDDGLGLIELLQRNKVNLDLIDLSTSHTLTNYCLLESNGNRTWLPPFNSFFPSLPKSTLSTKYVYMDLYEEAQQSRLSVLSELVRQNQRIFINLSATSIDDKLRLLEKEFYKKIEIIQISSSSNIPEAQKKAEIILHNLSIQAVIITLGKIGSVLCTHEGISTRTIDHDEKILRNMGAGATFSAGFLYGLMKGYSYEQAHIEASKKSIDFCLSKIDPLQ